MFVMFETTNQYIKYSHGYINWIINIIKYILKSIG